MKHPQWLVAIQKEANKGFDPHIKSYHMGWLAAIRSIMSEIATVKELDELKVYVESLVE